MNFEQHFYFHAYFLNLSDIIHFHSSILCYTSNIKYPFFLRNLFRQLFCLYKQIQNCEILVLLVLQRAMQLWKGCKVLEINSFVETMKNNILNYIQKCYMVTFKMGYKYFICQLWLIKIFHKLCFAQDKEFLCQILQGFFNICHS